MPLYTFRLVTSAGKAEMDLGFHRDDAAFDYAERLGAGVQIEVWRGAEHLKTLEAVSELADA